MDESALSQSRLHKLKATAKVMKKLLPQLHRLDCFLVSAPIHGNLGDEAIAIAEYQMLDSLGLRAFELSTLECGKQSYVYAKLLPARRPVLVHGGGFMGSIWPREELRLRRIIKAYADHPIIILPQTVTFDLTTEEGRQFFEESRTIYSAHKNLTLFVREEKSYRFMQEYMPQVHTVLVPDMVTNLTCPEYRQPRSGVLMCMRSDAEKKVADETVSQLCDAVSKKYPEEKITFTDTLVKALYEPEEREAAVESKLKEFAAAKLVITDRLHGMVFAALTGTPCIALQNSNGKVGAVYQWIKHNDYIRCVQVPEDAFAALNQIDIEREYHYDNQPIKNAIEPLIQKLK